MQRVCVFVDGENFRHSICSLFPTFNKDDHLPKEALWGEFFDHIVEQATGGEGKRLRTYWYVVRNLDFRPHKLYDATIIATSGQKSPNNNFIEYLTSCNYIYNNECNISATCSCTDVEQAHSKITGRKGVIQKRFAGWSVLYNGISNRHRQVEFRKEGAITYDLMQDCFLKEKSVDVALAIDMLELKDIYDVALIVSGDQDYIPAVKSVKNKGKIVANVSFKKENGKLLPGGAWRLNVETDFSLAIDHDTSSYYLNLI